MQSLNQEEKRYESFKRKLELAVSKTEPSPLLYDARVPHPAHCTSCFACVLI